MNPRASRLCRSAIAASIFISAGTWLPAAKGGFAFGQTEEAPLNLSTAIARVARQNIPSVVHIEVAQRQEVLTPFLPFENDPFFRYFFDAPTIPRKFKQELNGLGTGMIIDDRGHILTNNHVVAGATEIKVLLARGREFSGRIMGADPKTDLAVIRIFAEGPLAHVSFGDSDQVEVGDWVVAIGHPRGLDQTVTQGIISAKHRRGISDPSSYQDFLQTDAAINPGNSGGPLLNLRGEVIGVNAAIVSQSGGFEGIGFAIPSNMALYISKQLIAHGEVRRGWLGVSVQDLTQDLARTLNVESTQGALVADLVEGGPAYRAGVKRGDVVILWEGKPIPDARSLRNAVAISVIGGEVPFTIMREGKKLEITVEVGSLHEAMRTKSVSIRDRLGAETRPVTSREVNRYGMDSRRGAVITWLDPNGPLRRMGFEVNDVILEIDGRAIETTEDILELIGPLRAGRQVTLLALDHRSGRTGYVQVRLN